MACRKSSASQGVSVRPLVQDALDIDRGESKIAADEGLVPAIVDNMSEDLGGCPMMDREAAWRGITLNLAPMRWQ
jgi:hypothetical protein